MVKQASERVTQTQKPAALGAGSYKNRLAHYRAAATKAGWSAKQFELACDQAGDESSNDDDFFMKLCDFVDGSMECSYWPVRR